jgi:beta-galactosidase
LLDFQLFNAQALAEGLRFQAQLLKSNVASTQWVTTNFAYYKFLPSVDLFLNQKDFDFACHTMYLLSTYLDSPSGPLAHRLGSGLGLSFSTEFAQSVNGYTGIMEIQPGQINWGAWNSQPLPGAVRMWLWHAFSVGDRFISAYRFRQPLRGGEHYHAGIMETDGVTLARGGKEFVEAIAEMKALRKTQKPVEKLPKDVQSRKTAFLWKQANWLDMDNEPHTRQWESYRHFLDYYEGLKTMGSPVTFLQETDEFDPKIYPFMVAPAYQLVDQKLVAKWKKYAEAGGHLILSCRAGQKDQLGHLWEGPLYQPILDLIGAKVKYWDQLPASVTGKVIFRARLFDWNIWSDVLQPNPGTETLATHHDQFFVGEPTVTRKKYGKGSVTYIGTWSKNGELEREVMRKVYEEGGATILDLPKYVFSEYRDGLRIATNYSSFDYQIDVPHNTKFLIGEMVLKPGQVSVWKE